MKLTKITEATEIVEISRAIGEFYNTQDETIIKSIMKDKAANVEPLERKIALLKQIFLIFGEIDQEGEPLEYIKAVTPVFFSILNKYELTLVEIYEAAKMTASKEINAIKFGKISADFIGTFLHIYINRFRPKYIGSIRKAENRKARLARTATTSKEQDAPQNAIHKAVKQICCKYSALKEDGEIQELTEREIQILSRANFFNKLTDRKRLHVYKLKRKEVLQRLERELHELKSNKLISDHIVSAKKHFINRFKTGQTIEAYECKNYIAVQLFELLIKSGKNSADLEKYILSNYKYK